jgi:hypothetical protein
VQLGPGVSIDAILSDIEGNSIPDNLTDRLAYHLDIIVQFLESWVTRRNNAEKVLRKTYKNTTSDDTLYRIRLVGSNNVRFNPILITTELLKTMDEVTSIVNKNKQTLGDITQLEQLVKQIRSMVDIKGNWDEVKDGGDCSMCVY